MAYLLGSEYCIQSLQQDVKDLLQTLSDVESRTGQVKYQSWKFPDKMSCDVNVAEMLSEHIYNEDDCEESQVAHIMLYDLVIDRLVYLLQSFSHYNEVLLNSKEVGNQLTNLPQPKSGKSMSVGLSAKRCWSRITQTAISLQKIAKEMSRVNMDGSESDSNNSIPCNVNSAAIKSDSNLKSQTSDVSSGVRSISSQTIETGFDNCETCSRTQQCLYSVGEEIISICGTHSLPTSLGDWKQRFQEADSMSIADLTRWANYQAKDLSRISRHANSMSDKVKPLSAEIIQQNKVIEKLSKEISINNSVSERQKLELQDGFRKQLYLNSENEKSLSKRLKKVETDYRTLLEESEQQKEKLSKMKDDLLDKQDHILNIENERHRLKQETMEGLQYKQDAHQFKARLQTTEKLNNEVNEKMQSLEQQLGIAENKITSLHAHEKSLVKKHQSLLIRLGNLSEEAENIRIQLCEAEEERDKAVDKIRKMETDRSSEKNTSIEVLENLELVKEEKLQLQMMLQNSRKEKLNLEDLLQQYEEKEKLLIQYPDLNPNPVADINGSEDVLDDMANQIRANEIRIEVLNAENNKLQQTLQSMNKSNFNGHTISQRQHNSPIQLWQRNQDRSPNSSFNTSYTASEHSPEDHHEDMFYHSSSKTKLRHKTMATPKQGASAIDVYKASKTSIPARTSFTVGSGKRPPSSSKMSNKRPISVKTELYKPWT